MSEHETRDLLDASKTSGISHEGIIPKVFGMPGTLDRQNYESMDIEEGQELLERTRGSIERFINEALPMFTLGEQTKNILLTQLNEELYLDDAIIITHEKIASYGPPELLYGISEPENNHHRAQITIGHAVMRDTLKHIQELAPSANSDQIWRLALDRLIWHELFHGVHAAYERAAVKADDRQQYPPSFTDYVYDTIPELVPFPGAESKVQQLANTKAVQEGFAEGMLLASLSEAAKRELNLTGQQVEVFRTNLIKPIKVAARQRMLDILKDYTDPTIDLNKALADVVKQMNSSGFAGMSAVLFSTIGYGQPLTAKQIDALTTTMP